MKHTKLLLQGLGEDLIDGGEGYDEVNYAWGAGSERSVNVNLSTGQAVITHRMD